MSVEVKIELTTLPKCPRCDTGNLLPMFDVPYATNAGPTIVYCKGWACSNCGHNLFLTKGVLDQMQFHPAGRRDE